MSTSVYPTGQHPRKLAVNTKCFVTKASGGGNAKKKAAGGSGNSYVCDMWIVDGYTYICIHIGEIINNR